MAKEVNEGGLQNFVITPKYLTFWSLHDSGTLSTKTRHDAQHNNTHHNDTSNLVLFERCIFNCYAECHYAEFCYAECHYATQQHVGLVCD